MTDWSAILGPAFVLLAVGLGVGSCNYLSAAGDARLRESRAVLIQAERCGGRP